MGRTAGLALAVAATAVIGIAMPARANLVTNPGFETGGFAGWTVGGTPSAPSAINIGVDGNPADVNSGNFGAFAGNDFLTSLAQTIPTIKGATYAVDFFLNVYQADATFGEMTARFAGQPVLDLKEPTETDAFTHYTGSVVATASTSDLAFTFIDPPGFFGFDDVSVVETKPPPIVPEPAALPLLAGVVATWGARRRSARASCGHRWRPR